MFTENINRRSKLPYYQQLYAIFRGKIARGDWKPGDLIPTESELTELYQVSRNTVRQVLELLVNEGLIYRQRGRGSYVAHPSLEQSMVRIVSFTEDMVQRGFKPGTRILSAGLGPASPDIAAELQIEAGEPLACVERLRLADDEPMSIEESFLVHRFCPEVLQHDYAAQSLREILERDYGIRLVHARQRIQAINASKSLADLLEIKPRSALLAIERVSFSQDSIPVEFLRLFHRGDRYTLFNELHG